MTASLASGAVAILRTASPTNKVTATHVLASAWRRGAFEVGAGEPPDYPERPAKPELRRPGDMPRRSFGPKGRIALVHALAHIELNAVDLAWDIIARFTAADLPREFYDDWVDVAVEEAEHFTALAGRLSSWGAAYGDFPAHGGLWEASQLTADDLSCRLALIPMTLEARGIDTTPAAVAGLSGDDPQTAAVLERIYTDEIKHLAIGVRWFEFLCDRAGLEPRRCYAEILRQRFTGRLKPPFNLPARAKAGMDEGYLDEALSRLREREGPVAKPREGEG